MPQRELTLSNVNHSESMPSGAALLVDQTQMNDLVDRLQNGDPVKGWEGDNRLALAFNKPEQRWELWRLERDEQYSLVARSQPGLPFPSTIIDELVKRDVRRGYDPKASVDAHNDRVDQEKDYQLSQTMGPVYEKLAWALRKDDRTGAGL